MFEMGMERGQFDEDMKLSDGSSMKISKVYPLDAVFDTAESVPEKVASIYMCIKPTPSIL
jgi:enoyl-[acyl-carrier protein] reductase I